MGSSGDLPYELVEDILSRLPVESLVRFRCMSKSWSIIITEPTFVLLHLSRSMKRKKNELLRFGNCPYYGKPYSLSIEEDGGFSSLKQLHHIPYTPSMRCLKVSNSCHGIMCFYSNNHCAKRPGIVLKTSDEECPCAKDVVALFNPTTRDFRFLPQSHMISEISDGFSVQSVGIGYDCRTNDYMVVRIWKSRSCGRLHGNERFIFEKYALSADSWRRIEVESENPSLLREYDDINFGLHNKGVYYWWTYIVPGPVGWSGGLMITALVTLNILGSNGVCQKVWLPHPISTAHPRALGVLNGFVTLLCPNTCSKDYLFNIYDIWAMKDGVGAESSSCWTKLKRINTEHQPCVPMHFWKDNEIFFKVNLKARSYNIDIEEFQDIDDEVDGKEIFLVESITNYVESLVSIKGRN